MSGNISSTLINGGNFINNNFTLFCKSKASLGIQQRLKSRGFSTNTGRLCPGVQFLTLLDTIFDRTGTLYWQWYPPHILILDLCIPLNCCKCTVFKIWINHKTRPLTVYSAQFHSHCHSICAPFSDFFPNRNDSFPYPFIYFNKWNPNPSIYLKPENDTPFKWSLRV